MRDVWSFLPDQLPDLAKRPRRPDCLYPRANSTQRTASPQLIIVPLVADHCVSMCLQQPRLRTNYGVFAAALLVRVVHNQDFHFAFTTMPSKASL
jgi:hypothetical protein